MNPMPSNKIKIRVSGSEDDNGLVRLPNFLNALNSLMDALSRIDKLVTKSQSPSVYFRITELKYSSPATVETEILPLRPNVFHAPAIVDKYITSLKSIQQGKVPQDFDRGLLEACKRIAHGTKENYSDIYISSNGSEVAVTKKIETEINNILEKDEFVNGAVSGILEVINIHADMNKFNIYPIAGAEKIECSFPKDLKQIAVSGVGRRVLVHGELKYRAREDFPSHVKVDGLEVYPPDNELPSILELNGIAPHATGDLSSEEFISRLRGE
jgi:hypothetical protein